MRGVIDTLAVGLTRAAAREGGRLTDADFHRALPFLWVTLHGLADHYTGLRADQHPYAWDELLRFAVQVLADGLRARFISLPPGDTRFPPLPAGSLPLARPSRWPS